MEENKVIYIKDAKIKTQEEFVEKYNYSFLLKFAESSFSSIDKKFSFSTISIKSLDDLLKNETQAQNKEVLDIIPIIKTLRNPFASKIIVGRTSTQDIIIDDLLISKFHAYFENFGNNELALIERGSTNGTFINSVKIKPAIKNFIKDQDEISFGGIKYIFYSTRSAYAVFKKQHI